MTRAEALAALGATVVKIVGAYQALGILSGFGRECDDPGSDDNVRIICPDDLTVADLLRACANVLLDRSTEHKC